jgi:hypothetical protein
LTNKGLSGDYLRKMSISIVITSSYALLKTTTVISTPNKSGWMERRNISKQTCPKD